MASRTIVELTDDTDGKKADETVTFALDGVTYEIDLSARNAAAVRKALDPWITAGRRVSGRSARPTAKRGAGRDYDPAAVRAWAGSHKVKVSPRGRISSDVLAQFRAAGN